MNTYYGINVNVNPNLNDNDNHDDREQMWDKDFLYNDCIAEGMLDLGKHFRRAYKKKNEVLKLFESEQTERAKEAIVKTQQALKSEQVCYMLHVMCYVSCVMCFWLGGVHASSEEVVLRLFPFSVLSVL